MLIADCLFRRDEFVMKEMLQFLTAVKEPYFIRWWPIIYLLLRAPETSCASCNSVCSRITRIKSKLLSLLIFLSFSVREKPTNFRDVPSLRIDSQISHEILQTVLEIRHRVISAQVGVAVPTEHAFNCRFWIAYFAFIRLNLLT